jgi:hypothetical protein
MANRDASGTLGKVRNMQVTSDFDGSQSALRGDGAGSPRSVPRRRRRDYVTNLSSNLQRVFEKTSSQRDFIQKIVFSVHSVAWSTLNRLILDQYRLEIAGQHIDKP